MADEELENPVSSEETVEEETVKEVVENLEEVLEETIEEVIIVPMCEGKLPLMEHRIRPLSEIKKLDEVELLKEMEFRSESITGAFNPTLSEMFAVVQDDNEVLTKAIAFNVVKDSDVLDASGVFKTAKVRFYKQK